MTEKNKEEESLLKCSFCGKTQHEVKKLIAGPGVFICNECVAVCNQVVKMSLSSNSKEFTIDKEKINPKAIFDTLNNYVIGQEKAKKVLSVAVHNHYKRITNYLNKDSDVEIAKSNILLVGSTGSGKTLLAQTLARILDVPFAIADATTLTESGYVGDDVENIISRLVQNADGDISRAERGIIYIDEIDKITRKSENTSITRDVSGEGVQQALLKLIEGTIANINLEGGRKHPQQEPLQVNTTNILFICGGAFEGLSKIIGRRKDSGGIGFEAHIKSKSQKNNSEFLKDLEPDDLIKFGLIPELVGRLPMTTCLEELDENKLVKILTEPKNSIIKQYKKLFHLEDVELDFENDALIAIAKKAIKRKTGARGLRTIMEELLLDIMFDLPEKIEIEKITITEKFVTEGKEPKITLGKLRKPRKKSIITKLKDSASAKSIEKKKASKKNTDK